MTMNHVLLEELAREEEYRLHDRHAIGHTNGLKAAVLAVRLGEPLQRVIERAFLAHQARGQRDDYDAGFLDGLRKAAKIMGEEVT